MCVCVRACLLLSIDKLAERAQLDGIPQLYNDLRDVILTHAHKASVDEVHEMLKKQKTKSNKSRTKTLGPSGDTGGSDSDTPVRRP